MAGSAIAQTALGTVSSDSSGNFVTDVVIPSGTAPGFYDIAATGLVPIGSAYPPSPSSSGAISLNKTIVGCGNTIRVTGTGWAANTSISLRLELVNLAEANFRIAQTTVTRTARARIQVIRAAGCISPIGGGLFLLPNNAGNQPGVIINNNNSSSSSSSAAAAAGGGVVSAGTPRAGSSTGLVRTGITALPLLAGGLATILLGTVMLRAGRRRNEAESYSS